MAGNVGNSKQSCGVGTNGIEMCGYRRKNKNDMEKVVEEAFLGSLHHWYDEHDEHDEDDKDESERCQYR